MSRGIFNLFFDPCYILCITDRVNNIIQENRKLNLMIESVGILKHTLNIGTDNADAETFTFKSGSLIIRISTDNMHELENVLITDELMEMHEVIIMPDGVFPKEVFFAESIDNANLFLKKVKGKAITSGVLAEMEKAVIGTVQDTGHTFKDSCVNMGRVDAVIAYFLLPNQYILAVDDTDILCIRETQGFPGLRISHPNLKLSLHIEPYIGDEDCLSCYIMNNYEDWTVKLEAYNKFVEIIGSIDIKDGKVNINIDIPDYLKLDVKESSEEHAS